MRVTDVLKSLPGLIPEDAYDDNYPDGVAGHVNAGARIDTAEDSIRTPFGIDHEFSGAHLDRDPGRRTEEVGEERTDTRVKEAVAKRNSEDRDKRKTNTTGDNVTYGNMTLANTNPVRVLRANRNRRSVTLLCSSGGPAFVGKGGSISSAPSPDCVYLPNGVPRPFYHTEDVWIVGPANAVVDWTEENYTP